MTTESVFSCYVYPPVLQKPLFLPRVSPLTTAAVEAIGLDHIVLTVSDLERSSSYYAQFFGLQCKKSDQVWFQVANTRLALEPVPVRWQARHRTALLPHSRFRQEGDCLETGKLQVETASTQDHTLRFRDPNGFTIELAGSSGKRKSEFLACQSN